MHEVTGRIVDDSPFPLGMRRLVTKRDSPPYLAVDSTLLFSALAVWITVDAHGVLETNMKRRDRVMEKVFTVQSVLRAVLAADKRREISYLRAMEPRLLSVGELDTPGFRIVVSISLLGEAFSNALDTIYGDPTVAPKLGA